MRNNDQRSGHHGANIHSPSARWIQGPEHAGVGVQSLPASKTFITGLKVIRCHVPGCIQGAGRFFCIVEACARFSLTISGFAWHVGPAGLPGIGGFEPFPALVQILLQDRFWSATFVWDVPALQAIQGLKRRGLRKED